MILQPAGRREARQGQSQGQPSIAVQLILVSQDQEPVAGIKTERLGELWEQDRPWGCHRGGEPIPVLTY
jgi:hypothetical protein